MDGASVASAPQTDQPRWSNCLSYEPIRNSSSVQSIVIGVLPGEGIGPTVTECALEVLSAVADVTGLQVEIRTGGPIGKIAEESSGTPLPADAIRFCEDVFASGGAILNGPGGGRYVYDLRRHFDLFFKISPLQTANGLTCASPFKNETIADVDILVTRENSAGIYQGRWDEWKNPEGHRVAEHCLTYSENQARRFLDASARLARSRRGGMTVVWKESGIPSISRLWRDCAEDAAEENDIAVSMVDVDLMAYRLIREPATFDVIAAPNLFGDVLGDLGAVLLGSRGNSFSGNYTHSGDAVYQTNHGAAWDLVGTDRANPVGQIFSLAMMLRESFHRTEEAEHVVTAVRNVWSAGWRTEDVAISGSNVIGTQEMATRIAEEAGRIAVRSR